MSDKSKLGFNINPKNYDELNSTDNLITSGSDSGWLGKKLQGDGSNELYLSKINPLFDKELYEKYRPGVNANDGSVNQDIWGYKCFNSPVSFRNGIYGDTYNIQSIDTYEGDQRNNTKKNGIIIQPYNKQAGSLNNIDSAFRICNEKRSEQKDDKDLIYIDTRETHIQHSYTGKENQHNVEDVNLYEILKNTYIDGANTENISYTQSNVFPGSSEYSISFIQNTFDHCAIYSSNSTHRENAVTYNGINTFSNKKIDKQIGPFPYITTYNYKDFVNITSSIYYTNNIGTDEEQKHNYNISRITIGTECGNDPVIEKEITANNNCIRMYSADGTHGNSGYTNDNISAIIITPDYISISAKNNANQSTDNPYIKIDGTDNSITLHTGKLNLPDTIEVTTTMANFANKASILAKDINAQNYIIANDSSVIPNSNNTVSLGASSAMYKDVYAYNFYGLAAAAERLRYKDPRSGMSVDLLKASSLVSILPYQHNTVSIGSENMSFGNIYADKFIGTADKAKADERGRNIATTYFNKSINNTITGATTISRPGEVLRILPNSLDEEESCNINIATSDVDMRYKTTLNVHQQDNTNLACSLSLYAYHNNDVSSFSILPSVERTTSGILNDNVALNIGGKNNYFTNIYCKNFPTIHKTLGSNDAGPGPGTAVGNIRLLCIKAPTVSKTLIRTIEPGEEFEYPVILSDNAQFNAYSVECTIHIAIFKVTDNSNRSIGIEAGTQVAGKWVALSSTYIKASIADISPSCFPILAMRVE